MKVVGFEHETLSLPDILYIQGPKVGIQLHNIN